MTALRDLEVWFAADPVTRSYRQWNDILGIAFGAAEPQDLPAIASRAHARIHMDMTQLYLPLFTKPLMRRLQVDADAVEAFRAALRAPMSIRENNPILAAPSDPIASKYVDLQPLHRMYLFAVLLRHAGALPQPDATAVIRVLESASPDTVVHNPFTNHEGPLCLAVLDLIVH